MCNLLWMGDKEIYQMNPLPSILMGITAQLAKW